MSLFRYAIERIARKGRDLEGDYPGLDWHGNGDIVAFVPRRFGAGDTEMATKRQRPKPVHQMTEGQFEAAFPDEEEACKAYLVARRWPNGVICPRCGAVKVYPVSSMPFKWQCYQCAKDQGYRFSHIAGTIFENTNKPLRQWFKVVHLMTTSKKGIRALQIQRQMGFGTYETAHSMCHKIRAAMLQPQEKLGGIVEVDETWIGGKDSNRHWDKKQGGKPGGAGSARHRSSARCSARATLSRAFWKRLRCKHVTEFVREVVSNKVSLLATDGLEGYQPLDKEYPARFVDHQQANCYRRDAHEYD